MDHLLSPLCRASKAYCALIASMARTSNACTARRAQMSSLLMRDPFR